LSRNKAAQLFHLQMDIKQTQGLRWRKFKEKVIESMLTFSGILTILITIGILYVLIGESLLFFKEVSLKEFIADTQWTPLFTQKHYGIVALLSGTVLITLIAILVAFPIGLITAIYLNEYAPKKIRGFFKPILEILAAIPTVIYGFFALTIVTPLLQQLYPDLSTFNALSPGIVMGIMIIPYVSSMSEDALGAVPNSLREASYGMGATKFQTAFRVTVPAAFSGISASVILAIARAIGETMIVAIAAGQQPRFTFDPTVPIETITAYIVQVSLGDVPHGSIEYQTIFAAGLVLFLLTFVLNNISYLVIKRFKQTYE